MGPRVMAKRPATAVGSSPVAMVTMLAAASSSPLATVSPAGAAGCPLLDAGACWLGLRGWPGERRGVAPRSSGTRQLHGRTAPAGWIRRMLICCGATRRQRCGERTWTRLWAKMGGLLAAGGAADTGAQRGPLCGPGPRCGRPWAWPSRRAAKSFLFFQCWRAGEQRRQEGSRCK